MSPIQPTFVDLFSGCGGLSLGLMKAGWNGLLAVEKSPEAFKTLKHNLIDVSEHNLGKPKFAWPSWLDENPHEIMAFLRKHRRQLKSLRGKVHLVAGGPPCQGFSFAGKRSESDPRNKLFKYHLKVVDILEPEFVLLENVQGIDIAFGAGKNQGKRTRGRPRKSYASRIRDMLGKHGYYVQQHVIKAADFGVPQLRPRCFTLGIRKDILGAKTIDFIDRLYKLRECFLKDRGLPVNRPVNVFEALSDLAVTGKKLVNCTDDESPPGFFEITYEGPNSSYQVLMHGGMNGNWPNSLRLVNHQPQTISRFEKILRTCRKGVQLSQKDRDRLGIKKNSTTPLDPWQPSHTLTTLPDDLLHYTEPRIHTVREHARLQSFPDWFEFRGKFTTGGERRASDCPRYTQVGNAVPPLLAEILGEALMDILRELVGSNVPVRTFAGQIQGVVGGLNN